MKKIKPYLIVFLALLFIFLSVVLSDNEFNITNTLYLIISIASFGLGYLETISITKLGFGITRLNVFKRFVRNLIGIIFLMIFVYLFNQLMNYIVKEIKLTFIENNAMIIFFSLLIFTYGQLGVFFGNININKKIGSGIFLAIFIYSLIELYVIERKLFVNLGLFIISILLLIANYLIIKNAKLERS